MYPEFSMRGPKLTHFNSICWSRIPGAILEKFRGYITTMEGHLCVDRGVYFRMRVSTHKAYNKHGTRTSWLTARRVALYLEEYILQDGLISLSLFLSRAHAFAVEFSSNDESITPGAPPPFRDTQKFVRMPWIPVRFIDRVILRAEQPGQSPSETVFGAYFCRFIVEAAIEWMVDASSASYQDARLRHTRSYSEQEVCAKNWRTLGKMRM